MSDRSDQVVLVEAAGTHRPGCVQPEAAREHGQAAEGVLLAVGEQVVAPSDRRLQGPLAGSGVAALGQQPEPVFEQGEDLVWRQDAAAGSRQLDRQGDAIQPPADLGHVARVLVREREVFRRLLGAFDEELHRVDARQRRRHGRPAGLRHHKRRHLMGHLAAHVQRFAACCQHPQVRAGLKQGLAEAGAAVDHVLAAVQHEQHLLRPQGVDQRLLYRAPRNLA